MKILEDPIEIQSQGITKAVSFGIKQTGLAHILNVLRNQLYSDKILAVVREYTANAIDANREVGKEDLPIEVTMPSVFDPSFIVRDFGPALNEEEIAEVYAMYGESTKRNSNAQIGMLGLGSKSGFAYGDSFVINSYIDGERHSYTAYIDETKIGQIAKLVASPTDEKDGLEIIIPVREADIDKFISKSINLFKHFKVKPVIHGLEDHELDGLKVETLFEGSDWKYLKESGNNPVAVMGGIPYEWDAYDLDLDRDDPARSIVNDHLILEFEIGELNITASREALELTDITKKALITKIKKVSKELKDEVEKKFNGCNTMFDAKSLLGEICDYGSSLYELSTWARENITFNGKKIDDGKYNFYKYNNVNIRCLKKTRAGNLRFRETTNIECRDKVVVVKNDVGHFRLALGKIVTLQQEEEGRKVYLVTFDKVLSVTNGGDKPKTEKQICKEMGFDVETISLDGLPKPPKRVGNGVSYGRTTHKTFTWDKSGYRWGKWRDRWVAAEVDVDEDEGVYVVINRYKVQRPEQDYPYDEPVKFDEPYERVEKYLKEHKIEMPDTLHGFTKAESKKLKDNPNWVELHEWVADNLSEVVEEENLSELDRISSQSSEGKRDWFLHEWNHRIEELDLAEKLLGSEHPYVSVQRQYGESQEIRTKVEQIRMNARDWGFEIPKAKGKQDTSLKKLADEVEKDYPLVIHVDTSSYNARQDKGKDALNALCDYMKKLDECDE
jgi:hypothetical protein